MDKSLKKDRDHIATPNKPVFFHEGLKLDAKQCFKCGEPIKNKKCHYYIHSGKYELGDSQIKYWSCCKNENIAARGCVLLEEFH
jgi:hypothetical protein